ncbi:hypothetical protein GCM10022409_44360 [Hymenobacter glaciei]|uniref:Tetratricopeptide repeat protein n=1 Tax=Hymenobacter glaciei TaxID=877209 RepID=A0ABP7UTY0_9BACT
MKQVAWISIIPQLAILFLIGLIWYLCGAENPVFPTAATYLGLGFMLRNIVAKDHRRGMQLVKKPAYMEAIPFFESSYQYFTANAWVDKYRYLTLLSSSGMCYREMALCNIAFCYSQIGEGQKARAYYQRVLEVYPNNGLAQTALRMMESVEKQAE